MEFNNPSEIVKDLSFGDQASAKILAGVEKLTNAVKSTLGASGKCVIYEDALGRPVITKDGVTVAQSVVLLDPVENLGATLIKEAANNTVRDAGDGTTTATVLAHALLNNIKVYEKEASIRDIKEGINKGVDKVNKYLDKISIPVEGTMLDDVATISCNNDKELGKIIGEAYKKIGKDGVVLMEESETNETYVEFVDGVQFDSKLKSPHLATDKERSTCTLDNPLVLIIGSEIPNIRKIQPILEYAIKQNKPLLIVADMAQQPYATLIANKVKGNIKVNIVDPPGFGPTRLESMEDLAFLTGAKLINEELGDDLDLIEPSVLGKAVKAVTDNKATVLQVDDLGDELAERVESIKSKLKNETNGFIKKKLEQRLAMLSGIVGIVKVGADSKVELKEKKDRVEDAIHATKAAVKEGIVPGGGVALLNAANKLNTNNIGENILALSIMSPANTIIENAGANKDLMLNRKGWGLDVISGKPVNMIKNGIIDPVLVTKSALKNAVSVATTIVSADCIISNKRLDNASS
jgi:chaperonin GroEL